MAAAANDADVENESSNSTPAMTKDQEKINRFLEFMEPLERRAREINERQKLNRIWHRATPEIDKAITNLCKELESVCHRQLLPLRLSDEEDPSLDNVDCILLYRYLLLNTNFTCKEQLVEETQFRQFVNRLPSISVYLLLELIYHLRYEILVVESLIDLPLDLCVELLNELHRCIIFYDFSRSFSFLNKLIVKAHRKFVSLKIQGSSVFADMEQLARNFVDSVAELALIFNDERFLNFGELRESEVFKRKGLVIKALLQIGNACFILKSVNDPDRKEKTYRIETRSPQLLAVETCDAFKDEMDRHLLRLMLEKIKEIDCNCYMEWTEYEDWEEPGWSLQRAIGIESSRFLDRCTRLFADCPEYEQLAQSLSQFKSAEPLPVSEPTNESEARHSNDQQRRISCLNLLKEMMSTPQSDWERDSFLDYVRTILELLRKYFNASQLFEVVSQYADQMIGQHEKSLQKLRPELISFVQNDKMGFPNNHPLSLLLRDPEYRIDAEYQEFMIHLLFWPSNTIETIAKLAIGHAEYNLMYFSYENLDCVLCVLKMPANNEFDALLRNMMRKALLTKEDKDLINKLRIQQHRTRPSTVPLAVQVLQNIGFKAFSSFHPHLSVYLKLLIRQNIADAELLFHELLLPLLLQPSCSVGPVIEHLHSCVNIYLFPIPLYRWMLSRLMYNLPRDQSTNRYLVSLQLNRVQELYKCTFAEELDQPIVDKQQRLTYLFQLEMAKHGVANYSVERVAEDVLRREILRASQWQGLDLAEKLLASRGCSVACPCASRVEAFDLLIRIFFEACLVALEFPVVAAPNSPLFLLELLAVILSLAKSEDVTEVLASLSRHATMLQIPMSRTPLHEDYEKLVQSWQNQPSSRKEQSLGLNITLLRNFVEKADQLSDCLILKPGPATPLAVKLYFVENSLHYVDTKSIDKLLSQQIDKCFDTVQEK